MSLRIGSNEKKLVYKGSAYFRQRLVLSTLSTLPIIITNIRSSHEEPGIRDYEAGAVRLLDKLTNGSKIEINETGTKISYFPGILDGGEIEHECSLNKSIGYYLEMLLFLAPFCKQSLKVTLKGITNCDDDVCIDHLKNTSLKLLKKVGIDEALEIKMLSRGAKPGGGGTIVFTCPVVKSIKAFHWLDPGLVKRIRGIAYTLRVAPSSSHRMIEASRGILNRYLSDIYIISDHAKGAESGNSPGYGINLIAETTSGVIFSSEMCSSPKREKGERPQIPEELGKACSLNILDEIFRGGCVDTRNQSLVLLLMAMASGGVSRVLMGELTDYTIEFMRHLRDFMGVMFKVEERQDEINIDGYKRQVVYLSCSGIAYWNIGRPGL